MRYCSHCGHPIKDGQKVCTQCGMPIRRPVAPPPPPPPPRPRPRPVPRYEPKRKRRVPDWIWVILSLIIVCAITATALFFFGKYQTDPNKQADQISDAIQQKDAKRLQALLTNVSEDEAKTYIDVIDKAGKIDDVSKAIKVSTKNIVDKKKSKEEVVVEDVTVMIIQKHGKQWWVFDNYDFKFPDDIKKSIKNIDENDQNNSDESQDSEDNSDDTDSEHKAKKKSKSDDSEDTSDDKSSENKAKKKSKSDDSEDTSDDKSSEHKSKKASKSDDSEDTQSDDSSEKHRSAAIEDDSSSSDSDDQSDEEVTRENVIDKVESFEGHKLDTSKYTFKEPKRISEGWGFSILDKNGDLVGSYIIRHNGKVYKYDEHGDLIRSGY